MKENTKLVKTSATHLDTKSYKENDPVFKEFKSLYKDVIAMEVPSFWVVEYPSKSSSIEDICYETDALNIALQFKGGLSAKEIFMITPNKNKAIEVATGFMKVREDLIKNGG